MDEIEKDDEFILACSHKRFTLEFVRQGNDKG